MKPLSDYVRRVVRKATGRAPRSAWRLEQLEVRDVPAAYAFDFGTASSPVAPGYTGVPLAAYTAQAGYGWQSISGMSAVNRSTSNPLTTDLHLGTDSTFLVDVPNGQYDVVATLGDSASTRDKVSVWAEGQQLASNVTTSSGQFVEVRGRVTVADGQLTFRLADGGGVNNKFAVAGLTLASVNPSATSLWGGATPPAYTANDSNAVELGVRFQPLTSGSVSGVRFYKASANTGTHVGHLWTSTGTLLATATFTNETASGWQQVLFSQPVQVQAGTTYVVSYYAPKGNYSETDYYFQATGYWGGPLQALPAGTTGNGLYHYGATAFPTDTYRASNYWVDVVFQPAPSGPPPTADAGADQSGNEGSSVQFTGSATGTGLSYLWDFGDGKTASGTLTPTHTYADNGTYTVKLTVTDSAGRTATDTAVATIANVAPTAGVDDNNPVAEGSPVTIFFQNVADPSSADTAAGFKYSYDFNNDGVWDIVDSSSPSAQYTYDDNGTYYVPMRVKDKDGGSNTYVDQVIVTNVAPTASLGNSGPGVIGSPVNFAFANQSDPSGADTAAGFRYSYDFNGDGTWDVANSSSPTASYTYTAAGTYAARGRIADKDGGYTDYTTTVTVTGSSAGHTYYVATTGSDTAGDGSSAHPWATLQTAADAVQAGDTVIVRAGSYAGFILGWDAPTAGTAAAPITFEADPAAAAGSVVITAHNPKTYTGIDLEPGCDYITIQGFTIDGSGGGGIATYPNRGYGIKVTGNFDRVIGNTIRNLDYGVAGIHDDGGNGVVIQGNTVTAVHNHANADLGHGIYIADCDGVTVQGNVLHDNDYIGLHVNGDPNLVTRALISGNVIYNNGQNGINCDGLQSSTVVNNLIYGYQGFGICLFQIDASGPSKNNVIANNTIVSTVSGAGGAIRMLDGATGNTVVNNILLGGGGVSYRISADSLPGLVSDYNVVGTLFQSEDTGSTQSLSSWRSSTGQDPHSFTATATQLFANPSANDYHLSSTSPAIDKGTAAYAPATDLDGNSRPRGVGIDIGVYEF